MPTGLQAVCPIEVLTRVAIILTKVYRRQRSSMPRHESSPSSPGPEANAPRQTRLAQQTSTQRMTPGESVPDVEWAARSTPGVIRPRERVSQPTPRTAPPRQHPPSHAGPKPISQQVAPVAMAQTSAVRRRAIEKHPQGRSPAPVPTKRSQRRTLRTVMPVRADAKRAATRTNSAKTKAAKRRTRKQAR